MFTNVRHLKKKTGNFTAGCIGIETTVTSQLGKMPSSGSPEYENITVRFQVGYVPCL